MRRSTRSSLPPINKKDADKQLLHDYTEVRNSRLRGPLFMVLVYAGLVALVAAPLSLAWRPAAIVAVIGLAVFIGTMAAIAIRGPYGNRAKMWMVAAPMAVLIIALVILGFLSNFGQA